MKITKKISGESILDNWDIRRVKRMLAREVISRYRNTLNKKGIGMGSRLEWNIERLVDKKMKIEIIATVKVTNKELDKI